MIKIMERIRLRLLKISIGICAVVILMTAAFLTYASGIWRFNYIDGEECPVQGLDVSHHQGDIDWASVPRDQIRFVYIKATEGGDHVDRKFLENWQNARSNGFMTGAYHYFTLCRDGVKQVENFISIVPNLSDSLPPAIDLEYVGNCSSRPERGEFIKKLRDYISEVETRYNQKPVLYTTYNFFHDYLEGTEFASYPLWVRDIFKSPNAKVFPDWKIWQYADNLNISGIKGPVDINCMK